MAVATKAKLESVVVNGGCECIEPPNSNSQPQTTITSTGGGQQIQTTTYMSNDSNPLRKPEEKEAAIAGEFFVRMHPEQDKVVRSFARTTVWAIKF